MSYHAARSSIPNIRSFVPRRLLEVYHKLRDIAAATTNEATQTTLLQEAKNIVQEVCSEHVYAVQANVVNDTEIQQETVRHIEEDCLELQDYLVAAKRFSLEVNARSKDRVVSFGERLSCRFMAAMLKDRVR